MQLFFLVCACLGGTIIVGQFVLMLFGLGNDDLEFDGDLDTGSENAGEHVGAVTDENGLTNVHDHASAWLFGVLTLRTVTSAIAFFGLAGFAAGTAGFSTAGQLGLALLSGVATLYGVHWLMTMLVGLRQDGTQRIERAVGQRATVYLTVPALRAGSGKVQFKLQNRLVDYEAVTDHALPLRTGSKVRVVGVVSPGTVAVMPQSESADALAS